MLPGFLINLGEWALRMLFTEPARPFGGPVFEIQGFLAAFSLRAEKVIARCEEQANLATSLRSQNFTVSVNRFNEPAFIIETMCDI